jgi:hypothetical protein
MALAVLLDFVWATLFEVLAACLPTYTVINRPHDKHLGPLT